MCLCSVRISYAETGFHPHFPSPYVMPKSGLEGCGKPKTDLGVTQREEEKITEHSP